MKHIFKIQSYTSYLISHNNSYIIVLDHRLKIFFEFTKLNNMIIIICTIKSHEL